MKRTPLLRALLFAALAGAIVLAVVYRDQIDVATLEAWIKDTGALGPAVFMLAYVIGTVLFLPGSVLTLAGGALFGPVAGTFYNLTGATLGAALRSEEHTSELQSQFHLVCRLLLEKKK